MAEILEIIDDVKILPNNSVWTIPQALIQQVAKAEHQGQSLVKNIKYHPSRQSRLHLKFTALNQTNQAIVHQIAKDINILQHTAFTSLKDDDKQQVLDTLLDYYQFIRDESLLEEDRNNSKYRQVLAARYQLPPGISTETNTIKKPPHLGRKPSLVSFSNIHNSAIGDGISVRIRPAYYDALDADYGHIKNASLTMGEAHLTLFNDDLTLRNLTFIKIESVSNAVTRLPEESGRPWRLEAGLEQLSLSCQNCLIAKIQGDIGQTFVLNNKLMVAGFLGGSIQENNQAFGSIHLNTRLLANIEINAKTRVQFSSQYREHLDSSRSGIFINAIRARYQINNDMDLRFSYEKNIAEEITASVSFYW